MNPANDATAVARKRLETMRLVVQLMELGLDILEPLPSQPSNGCVETRAALLRFILGRRDPEAVCLLKNDPTLARLHGEPWFQALWEEMQQSPGRPPSAP